jgi:hypothetical protein
MNFRTTAAAALLTLLAFSPLVAEKVDMSPEQLRKTATHVVKGKVQAIYSRVETDANWKTTRWLAEVAIEEAEKGEGLAKGGLVYARYWTREWVGRGDMPSGTNGHRGLPKEGQSLRIYLAKDAYDGFGDGGKDGGYNVIGANGFEAIE